MNLEQLAQELKYDARGLVPAVVQHASTGQVLMVGYMNSMAFLHTIRSGKATFWSRSRNALWVKGETSGNYLTVREVRVDCDRDCVLVVAEPAGEVCHEGYPTCFFRRVTDDGTLAIVEERSRLPEEIYGRQS